MAKFYDAIGYAELTETEPGSWTEKIVERKYYGDVLSNNRRLQPDDKLNDDIRLSNRISIVADPYARHNYFNIRYVRYMGAKWKVSDVDASRRPRMILTTGGLYNDGQTN